MTRKSQASAEPVAPAPRKRDAERTRKAILKAAVREFAAHGYSGARTERIAASAKCNVRLLYHYFGSKEQLYLTVLESAYEDLRGRERLLKLDMDDPLGALLELVRFTFDYFAANPSFESLLRNENMMRGRFVRKSARVPQGGGHLRETIERLLAAGATKGTIRPGIDPVQLYVTIAALSRFHLANGHSLSATLDTDLSSPAWRATRRDHAVELLHTFLTSGAGQAAALADRERESSPA